MKLLKMKMHIVFDCEVTEEHYIVPGGYEIETDNRGTKKFDFCQTEWTAEGCSNTLVIEASGMDEDFSDELTEEDLKEGIFKEFFIYTGEYGDPEIRVKRIEDVSVEFLDEKEETRTIRMRPEQLRDVNLEYEKQLQEDDTKSIKYDRQ